MTDERLREAAALMRERAAAAHPSNPDWHYDERYSLVVTPIEGMGTGDRMLAAVGGVADGKHIASWHPAVAVAVSRLLDAVSEHIASHDCEAHCEPGGCAESRDAYDLARAYLGGAK